jgi:CDP-diacylglycerol--glycerol-3-phosphate 3-phosphatidyltransferase
LTQVAEEREQPKTLTEHLRLLFKDVLDSAGAFLHCLGFRPNILTLLGLVGNLVGASFLLWGKMVTGGLVILLMGPMDALDGAVARQAGKPRPFGAFFDSVIDRYSDLVVLLGLLLYYLQNGDWLICAAIYLAAAGSVLVSYTRARAESLGFDAKIGLLSRFERYSILSLSLIFNIPKVGIGIVAVLANVTALQRILYVRRQAVVQERDQIE